jgi:4-aminobutyrate aminotransferase-like enzyme
MIVSCPLDVVSRSPVTSHRNCRLPPRTASILTDSRGRKYIDFVMGWCVGNFGWRRPATTKAIERFKGPDYIYPGYSYAPWRELARLLASLAPRPLTTCFRATGGSEAVDLALQAAMIHTGRRAFLSLEDSYHGNSLAGLSIGASDSHRSTYRRERPGHAGALDLMRGGVRTGGRSTCVLTTQTRTRTSAVQNWRAAYVSYGFSSCRRGRTGDVGVLLMTAFAIAAEVSPVNGLTPVVIS